MNNGKIFIDVLNKVKVLTLSEKILLGAIKPKRKIKKLKDTITLVDKSKLTYILDINDISERTIYNRDLYSIMIPSKDFIMKYANVIIDTINDNDPENRIYAFVTFKFNKKHFYKIDIFSKEYDTFIDEQIEELIQDTMKYKEDDYNLNCVAIIISITISKFENINKWFDFKVPKFIEYSDFTLFTANGDNCVKDCVEYLGYKYDITKSFEDNLPENSIIINYIPILRNMNNIKLLNDFLSDSNNYDTDCKNVIRTIKFNGHMGLITSIRRIKYNKIQHKTRIKIDKREFKELFMDIESFTENNIQKPYLLCWFYDKMNVEIGLDCTKSFINKLVKLNENIIMYAWYGSGYDYQYLIVELLNYYDDNKYIIKNNMISYAEFHKNGKTLILKDPYLFILTSLDKAAKSFKVKTKGTFPHQLIKKYTDIYKIEKKWPSYNNKLIELYNENQYHIKLENVINYVDNDEKTIDKAVDYCKTDVIAMKETWIKFKTLLKNELDLSINPNTFTLSQLSMMLMESKLPKHVKIYVPDREVDDFLREALYGGRVIAKNGVYNEEIIYADVVSLYPSAMRLLEHAYGKAKNVTTIDWNKHGIYKVKLKHKSKTEPKDYLEFVPRRIDGRLKWNWFEEHVGTYHTYDLLIAINEGYNITLIEGIEYESKGYIFNEYIDVLYKLKEDHSNCKCEEQPCPIRMVAKIALNGGGYGKFVQKPVDKEVYIVKKDVVAGECERLKTDELGNIMIGGISLPKPKFFDLDCNKYDKMIIQKKGNVSYSTQCGISILSGSRYRLYKECKKFKDIKIIYSDTDSIYVLKKSVDWEKFKQNCGTDLGQLDNFLDENNEFINKMIIGGPKMYGYTYGDNVKLYCKGVPKKMLNLKQFEYLVENKDNRLYYEFEILRRKLVSIETKDLIKEIKQTGI